MASNEKEYCAIHEDKEMKFFCETCSLPICLVCFEEEHQSHKLILLQALPKKQVDKSEVVLSEYIAKFQHAINDHRLSMSHFSKHHKENKERVESCRDKIIMVTNTITNKIMSSLDNEQQSKTNRLSNTISCLEKDINDLENSQNSKSRFDSDVIQLDIDWTEKYHKLNKSDTGNTKQNLKFVPGEINTQILEIMLGQILNGETKKKDENRVVVTATEYQPSMITVKPVSSFSHSESTCRLIGIYPSGDTKAWVHRSQSAVNELVTFEGHHEQQLEMGTKFADCVEVDVGVFIVTDFDGYNVFRITSSGEKSLIKSTEPLQPLGISLTFSGDLLITLVDDFNYYISANSQRLVRRMSLTGQIKQTYQLDQSSEALFTIPYRAQQNYNSDICVVDQITNKSGQIYILQEDGRVKCQYTGPNQHQMFAPLDITFDLNCNILVSDFNNHTVHLLDRTGQFIKYLTDDHLNSPRCLCLYNNNLWVGCNNGKICVFDYKF